ncbi:MFS transporter [Streptococcus equinus]|uniref:MFS transporter n=1 Tax=Streptococcus equinus TaxID=1335 RepID=UPI0004D455AE|nr:MFS transporter [Streptococcus equinus]KEY47880.1 MFS transporter [Streptococcus equinus]QGX44947.1 MFS transporter [Streptococcus equinus]GEB10545.1 hypothetical protein SEQ01_07360 [Streptococcus equinus]
MSNKKKSYQIGLLFLVFTLYFTFFRSSMSGILSLFYISNGISEGMISSIKSFQNIGILLGLLPSGFLADKYGRLKIIVTSSLVISFSFFIMLANPNYYIFSFAEFLYGIGLALNSGTLLAYITSLQENYNVAVDSKLMGRQVSVLNFATLLGGNIGTWLFKIDNHFPVIFSAVGLLTFPIFIFLWIKFFRFTDNRSEKYTRIKSDGVVFKNINDMVKRESFWELLAINLGYDCGTQFILIYWSILYVENLQFNLSIVYTIFIISLILGSEFYRRYIHRFSMVKITYYVSALLISIFICSYYLENRFILLILFFLIEFIMGILSAQISALSNKIIYGYSNKSQMLTTVSFVTESVVIVSLVLNNFILEILGELKIMYIVSAVYMSLVFLPLLSSKFRKKISL